MAYKFQLGKARMSGSVEREGNLMIETGSTDAIGVEAGFGSGLFMAQLKYDGTQESGMLELVSGSSFTNFYACEKLSGSVMDTLAGPALSFTQSSGIMQVNVDSSTIEVSSDALQLVNAGVSNAKLAGLARGHIKVGDSSGRPVDLDANDDGKILVGDGFDLNSVAVSGDASLANTGALTIANGAISNAKLAGLARGHVKIGNNSGVAADVDASDDGKILVGDGLDVNSVAISGDVSLSNAGLVTIQAGAVESGMLNNNVISGQTELAAGGMAKADELFISDAGTLKKIGVDNFATDLLKQMGSTDITPSTDFIVFLSGSSTGDAKRESIADLATAQAGAGIDATSGVFSTTAAQTTITSLRNDALTVGRATGDDFIDFSSAGDVEIKTNNVVRVSVEDATTTVTNDLVVGGDLTVNGTVTTIDSTTINVSSSFTFEGPADAHETTLHAGGDGVGDAPKADTDIYLPALNAGDYFLPVLADKVTQAAALVTAAEFAQLDGGNTPGSDAPAAADGFLHNHGGTLKHTRIDALIGAAAGDGLVLNGVQLDLDINGLANSVTAVAQADILGVVDSATSGDPTKKITFSNFEDQIFSNINANSGQFAMAAGGALQLSSGALSLQTNTTSLASGDQFLTNTSSGLRRTALSSIASFVSDNLNETVLTVTSATHTITANAQGTILANNASGVTITLAAASDHEGKRIVIKKIGAGDVTIVAPSGQIDGLSHNVVLESPMAALTIISDGTDYFII